MQKLCRGRPLAQSFWIKLLLDAPHYFSRSGSVPCMSCTNTRRERYELFHCPCGLPCPRVHRSRKARSLCSTTHRGNSRRASSRVVFSGHRDRCLGCTCACVRQMAVSVDLCGRGRYKTEGLGPRFCMFSPLENPMMWQGAQFAPLQGSQVMWPDLVWREKASPWLPPPALPTGARIGPARNDDNRPLFEQRQPLIIRKRKGIAL